MSTSGLQRVLVADVEDDLVTSYERLLRRQGYHVITTGSRHGGLALITREPLVLVITELLLPDGNGLDLVRAARHQPSPVPALVVTGFGTASSREVVFGAGAHGYLVKPFAIADFTALVAQAVQSRRRSTE